MEPSASPGGSGLEDKGSCKKRTLSQLLKAVGSPITPGVPEPLLPLLLKTLDQTFVSKGFVCMVKALIDPEDSYKAS